MNYRHVYHAGNFADVFKHLILVLVLEHLRQKPTPFCVLDAHAGIGLYDLRSEAAQKTGEAVGGVLSLLESRANVTFPETVHTAVKAYFAAIESLNPDVSLKEPFRDIRYYPGSPRLARRLLRVGDRLVASERHPEDFMTLKRAFAGDRQVEIHNLDAYEALKARLPPPERRGVVLLDPPFEATDEFERLARGLQTAYRRWPTGVYLAWHPIKERAAVWRFHEALIAAGIQKMMAAELMILPEDDIRRLNGCGMIVVNPPWRFDQKLRDLLPVLHRSLGAVAGGGRIDWLVGSENANSE
ncbi:Ribosomal RNA large subunit methyltransferase J [Azospirillaceae bacterium]